jgi:hypothetical protein
MNKVNWISAISSTSKGGILMELAKLDAYDYTILPGVIQIRISSTNDPDLVDIMSEITRSNKIYIDGLYYRYLDRYEIVKQWQDIYLELHVVEIA